MSTRELRDPLSNFPLTSHEAWYLKEFAHGKTTSDLSKEGLHLKAADHAAIAIRRKLASRTLAQSVWKAWEVGIKIPEDKPIDRGSQRFMSTLDKESRGVMQMIAGGYYAVEIDPVLGISRYEREKIIKEFYTQLPAVSYPQIVFFAVRSGFFNKHSPKFFSEGKHPKPRPEDQLSPAQSKLLHLIAEGRTYAEIAAELTRIRGNAPVSIDGVRSRLDGLRFKIAKLSGLPVLPPYQTVIRAADLGLFPLKEYLDTKKLNPSLIATRPKEDRDELEEAYDRVLISGEWIGTGRNQSSKTKRLRMAYTKIGANNPMQAVLMIHYLKKTQTSDNTSGVVARRGPKETPNSTVNLIIPNGLTFLLPGSEIEQVSELGVADIPAQLARLRESGYVTAEDENSGGRVITALAGILKGDMRTYTPKSTDLTYRQLREAYQTLETVLGKYPQVKNIGSLLKLVEQRLKKISEDSRTS